LSFTSTDTLDLSTDRRCRPDHETAAFVVVPTTQRSDEWPDGSAE